MPNRPSTILNKPGQNIYGPIRDSRSDTHYCCGCWAHGQTAIININSNDANCNGVMIGDEMYVTYEDEGKNKINQITYVAIRGLCFQCYSNYENNCELLLNGSNEIVSFQDLDALDEWLILHAAYAEHLHIGKHQHSNGESCLIKDASRKNIQEGTIITMDPNIQQYWWNQFVKVNNNNNSNSNNNNNNNNNTNTNTNSNSNPNNDNNKLMKNSRTVKSQLPQVARYTMQEVESLVAYLEYKPPSHISHEGQKQDFGTDCAKYMITKNFRPRGAQSYLKVWQELKKGTHQFSVDFEKRVQKVIENSNNAQKSIYPISQDYNEAIQGANNVKQEQKSALVQHQIQKKSMVERKIACEEKRNEIFTTLVSNLHKVNQPEEQSQASIVEEQSHIVQEQQHIVKPGESMKKKLLRFLMNIPNESDRKKLLRFHYQYEADMLQLFDVLQDDETAKIVSRLIEAMEVKE